MKKMSQARKIKLIVFIIITTIVIIYVNNRIAAYDMRFYNGKDDGVLARLESVCILSILFFLFMCKQNRIINLILGFIVGLISSIVCYFAAMFISNDDLLFHVLSCVCFVMVFFAIEKFRSLKINKKH
jgi:ABC-type multidrug transport system permease subunit